MNTIIKYIRLQLRLVISDDLQLRFWAEQEFHFEMYITFQVQFLDYSLYMNGRGSGGE